MRNLPSQEVFEVICKHLYPDLLLKHYDVDSAGNVALTFFADKDVYCTIPYPSDSYVIIDRLDSALERVWKANGVSAETRRSTPDSLRLPPVPSSMLRAENQPGTPGSTSSGSAKNAADPSAPL